MLINSMAMAVPAFPGSTVVLQPDGTQLTVRPHGDEYRHYTTTADGYTIVRADDGFYTYATLNAEGRLVSSGRVAHDAASRSASENAWLAGIQKNMAPAITDAALQWRQDETERQAASRSKTKYGYYDYNNFRGLIILVQFIDRQFSSEEYTSFVNDMVNSSNYTGYDNTRLGRYTGSVRDYFYDNSMGAFSPQFDIVGPVTVNFSQYSFKDGNSKIGSVTLAALNAADAEVDFSLYDGDGNGEVDIVYFIFAGLGSNYGNDERLIWPHASYITQQGYNWRVKKDDVYLGRYACSTELGGTTYSSWYDGIGTICHEFSHVLGLPDLYDVDYEKSGGESDHPDTWCIMAGGPYLNNGRTPAGYSLYERYAIGFASPEVINSEGSIELPPIADTNMGYKMQSPVKKEFFLIENRQKTSKWDQYLPGHGMLVFRVDSTNVSVWHSNAVNNNPSHNYFELIRACGKTTNAASDPFPGTGAVRNLTNVTSPANLLTWDGMPSKFAFENIQEKSGIITFNVVDVNMLKSITLPESITLGRTLTRRLEETRFPDYAPYKLQWLSADESIATVDAEGVVTAVAVGETDVTVTANDDPQLSATCHVIVEDLNIAASISEYRAFDHGTEAALLLNDALVVYADGSKNAYLRDVSGAIVVDNATLELEAGDKLNGSIYGLLSIERGVPHLKAVENLTNDSGYTLEKGYDVMPREIAVEDVTEADYADMITLRQTPLIRDNGIWAVAGEHRIRVYNTFQLKGLVNPTTYEGKYFDVTGIYLTNTMKDGTLVDELAMLASVEETEGPSGVMAVKQGKTSDQELVTLYTMDGRKVATAAYGSLNALPLRSGVYVVKTASGSWRIVK